MMKYFEDFKYTGDSFAERIYPDMFSSAIGLIATNFSELDEVVSKAIHKMIAVGEEFGQIVTAEISFKNKIHILSSLGKLWFKNKPDVFSFPEPLEQISELVVICTKSEELRNRVFHSYWAWNRMDGENGKRRKVTAKSSKGLRVDIEEIDAGKVLDIADYIIYVASMIEEVFMLNFCCADES